MSFSFREPIKLSGEQSPYVDWEEPTCLLCGGTRWAPLVEAPDRTPGGKGLWFMVVQCHGCGLCFTNPRPTPQCISAFYPANYGPRQIREQRGGGPRWWHQLPLLAGRRRHVRKVLPLHGQGRLLDFGCGSGTYLTRMRQQGWQVTGLDISAEVVARLRSEFGLEAVAGTLPHPDLKDASFDVVTMWQALEHVHQPLEVLEAARRLLAPGGKLIVAVPNIDSLAFRWFGAVWHGLELPRHLTHFTPDTLRLMVQRAGFRVRGLSMVRHGGWLRLSARLAAQHAPGVSRWRRWLQRRPIASIASWYATWTRQADCILVSATR